MDLSVALDFYITETTAHCDYVLPVTTMYERDDFPVTFQTFQATPFRQATEAVVAPAGQARTEWEIFDDLMQRMGARTPVFTFMSGARKLLSLFDVRLSPRLMIDAMIRHAAGGNRFGLRRGGLTFRRLTSNTHTVSCWPRTCGPMCWVRWLPTGGDGFGCHTTILQLRWWHWSDARSPKVSRCG